jgi:hypothetical protein
MDWLMVADKVVRKACSMCKPSVGGTRPQWTPAVEYLYRQYPALKKRTHVQIQRFLYTKSVTLGCNPNGSISASQTELTFDELVQLAAVAKKYGISIS